MARIISLEGQRFGRLIVIADAGPARAREHAWECRCDCGTTCFVVGGDLRRGATKSCGCLRRELADAKRFRHGRSRDSSKDSPYRMWAGMLTRCRSLDPSDRHYRNYKGKGVHVIDEWLDYRNFHTWAMSAGWAPGLTIDRIDSSGPYAPWNCRFLSLSENSRLGAMRRWER
jgi:hypothetical protein